MSWIKNPGRIAGFLYLLLVVATPVRPIYIPSALFVRGNATATANNIAAHELLFRLGIVSDLFGTSSLECGNLLPLWSSATCRRRPPPHCATRLNGLGSLADGCDRSQTTKALTGQRTPKRSVSLKMN